MAFTPSGAAFYRQFGLNDREIEIVARGVPKRDYYLSSPHGNRLFELALGEIGLCYCGATSKEQQVFAEKLWLETKNSGDFNREYLLQSGLGWACSYLPEDTRSEKGKAA